MDLFKKKIGTVFLKENSDAEKFISEMTELSKCAEGQLRKEIETQIKLASYGVLGEKNIAFELKNSGIDMYVLHDLCLEFDGLKAQIDYLIVTRQRIYVIECKNLIGNIEIDSSGNFIRSYELFGKKIKESLYSPITQNQRHMMVIKGLRSPDNIIKKHFFEKHFEDTYKSVVVLSNPKTYLNAKFAKKEVKNHVIRADALISYIRETDRYAACDFTNEEMLKVANLFLKYDNPERSDYSLKYKEIIDKYKDNVIDEKRPIQIDFSKSNSYEKICPRCGSKLVLRVAKKGNNSGNEFYGCSSFPKCRYIEKIEVES